MSQQISQQIWNFYYIDQESHSQQQTSIHMFSLQKWIFVVKMNEINLKFDLNYYEPIFL